MTWIVIPLILAPWIAAAAWVCSREDWRALWSDDRREFPTQASRWRAFGGS